MAFGAMENGRLLAVAAAEFFCDSFIYLFPLRRPPRMYRPMAAGPVAAVWILCNKSYSPPLWNFKRKKLVGKKK